MIHTRHLSSLELFLYYSASRVSSFINGFRALRQPKINAFRANQVSTPFLHPLNIIRTPKLLREFLITFSPILPRFCGLCVAAARVLYQYDSLHVLYLMPIHCPIFTIVHAYTQGPRQHLDLSVCSRAYQDLWANRGKNSIAKRIFHIGKFNFRD